MFSVSRRLPVMDIRTLLPLARELLSLRVKPGFLRVYLVGSMLAPLGTAVGVVEMLRLTFCADHSQETSDGQYEELLDTLRELKHRKHLTDAVSARKQYRICFCFFSVSPLAGASRRGQLWDLWPSNS
uniref:Uncharacterized protein n=1 Tax=Pygocentrus nattereri TaxID=42514 RepID=A0A3B4BKX5_PYGNA